MNDLTKRALVSLLLLLAVFAVLLFVPAGEYQHSVRHRLIPLVW